MTKKIKYQVKYTISWEDTAISFTVKYRHKTWNQICWTYDGEIGEANFYFNDEIHHKAIPPKIQNVNGYPDYDNQFLVFGQEPDSFKGGYHKHQLLQGKISRFNWWSSVLEKNEIESFAKCKSNEKGNIVEWTRDHFFHGLIDIIEEIDPRILCNSAEVLLFFPGRRRRDKAIDLCAAHGGWIVAPDSPEENIKVLNMYKENIGECKHEDMDLIGWLGVNNYDGQYFVSQSNSIIKTIIFNNFPR